MTYEESKALAFQKRWGLYDQIVLLANGDLLKVQELFELTIITIFNHLSYLMDKNNK